MSSMKSVPVHAVNNVGVLTMYFGEEFGRYVYDNGLGMILDYDPSKRILSLSLSRVGSSHLTKRPHGLYSVTFGETVVSRSRVPRFSRTYMDGCLVDDVFRATIPANAPPPFVTTKRKKSRKKRTDEDTSITPTDSLERIRAAVRELNRAVTGLPSRYQYEIDYLDGKIRVKVMSTDVME